MGSINRQILLKKLIKEEGKIPHMYLDSIGKVTIGIGHLLDKPEDAEILPFIHKKTQKNASKKEILKEYSLIKSLKEGQKANYYKSFTNLFISEENILKIFNSDIEKAKKELPIYIKKFTSLHPDVQLALFDLYHLLGLKKLKKYKNLKEAILNENWKEAKKECDIKIPSNQRIRNKNRKWLFQKMIIRDKYSKAAKDKIQRR